MPTIAIDWSGAASGARKAIWLAEVVDDSLVRLEAGRSRQEVVQHVIDEAERHDELVVGLDFAFSFPEWFVAELGVDSPLDLWDRVSEAGEEWLRECEPPFWGRPGRKRPELRRHFRRTERAAAEIDGAQPKSVFQVGGAGAVGTGSIRGMPLLGDLSRAGFSVWPFEDPSTPLIVEIYPRLLTGKVVKSDPAERSAYLEEGYPELDAGMREVAASSEDAFDAAVSAVVMARHRRELVDLPPARDSVDRLEGRIWIPGLPDSDHVGDSEPGSAATTAGDPRPADAGLRRSDAEQAATVAAADPAPDAASEPSPAPDLSCPFCALLARDVIAASEHAIAIHDAYPVSDGHALVLPRTHVESVFDLPIDEQLDLWSLVARVRSLVRERNGAVAFNIGVNDGEAAGQTIPHAHVHVIPRSPGDVDDPRGGVRRVLPERAAYWE